LRSLAYLAFASGVVLATLVVTFRAYGEYSLFILVYGVLWCLSLGSILLYMRLYGDGGEADIPSNIVAGLLTTVALIAVMVAVSKMAGLKAGYAMIPLVWELEEPTARIVVLDVAGLTFTLKPLAFFILLSQVLVAFAESAFFHVAFPGVIYSMVEEVAEGAGMPFAVLVPNLIFGALHYQSWGALGYANPFQVLAPAFIGGCVLTIPYIIGKALGKDLSLAVILAHMTFNMLGVLARAG